MIKFTEIEESNIKNVAETVFGENALATQILESFDFDDEASYAVTEFGDCLLVRIFDYGRYLFLYPFELSENARVEEAILEMTEYAMREEIGLTLTDVPMSGVSKLLELGFLHLDVDAEGERSFRVKVKTECELADTIPEFDIKGLHVSALREEDKELYAEICRDEELGRFWGYDYREDAPDADDEFFLNEASLGFARGVSLTLALRNEETFLGILELFAFDGRGGCEFALKIAREHQGRGYGSVATEAAIEAARRLGVLRISCDVMNENIRSVSIMKKYLTEAKSNFSDRKHFILSLL